MQKRKTPSHSKSKIALVATWIFAIATITASSVSVFRIQTTIVAYELGIQKERETELLLELSKAKVMLAQLTTRDSLQKGTLGRAL